MNVTDTNTSGTSILTLQGFGTNGAQMTSLGGGLYALTLVGVPQPASVTVTTNLGATATSPITRLR